MSYQFEAKENTIPKFYGYLQKPEINAFPYPFLNAIGNYGKGIHKVLNNINVAMYFTIPWLIEFLENYSPIADEIKFKNSGLIRGYSIVSL